MSRKLLIWASILVMLIGFVGTALIVPPHQGGDEKFHFYRTVQLSEGRIIPIVNDPAARPRLAGGMLDTELVRLSNFFSPRYPWPELGAGPSLRWKERTDCMPQGQGFFSTSTIQPFTHRKLI